MCSSCCFNIMYEKNFITCQIFPRLYHLRLLAIFLKRVLLIFELMAEKFFYFLLLGDAFSANETTSLKHLLVDNV